MKSINNNTISLVLLTTSLFSIGVEASPQIFTTRFAQEKNTDQYLEKKYTFNYANFNNALFRKGELENQPSLFFRTDVFHSDIEDKKKKYESNSLALSLGKKVKPDLYTEGSLGVKNIKAVNQSRQITSPIGAARIVYDKDERLTATLKYEYDYLLYSSDVKSNSINPSLFYLVTDRFSTSFRGSMAFISDENIKHEDVLEFNYTISEYEPWIAAGFTFEYLRYQKDMEDKNNYWSPNKVYTLGPNVALATPITNRLGLNFYYAYNRTKDFSVAKWGRKPVWSYTQNGLIGLTYKYQNYKANIAIGKSNSAKVISAPAWASGTDDSNITKKTDQITLGFSATF